MDLPQNKARWRSGYINVEVGECQFLEISAEPNQVQEPVLPTVQAVSMSLL
jgi:hypothetical protein